MYNPADAMDNCNGNGDGVDEQNGIKEPHRCSSNHFIPCDAFMLPRCMCRDQILLQKFTMVQNSILHMNFIRTKTI